MASGIGHVLRQARRNLGVTLTEAAQRTRVRETHLAALERDELESIGIDPVYVRGILRTYADYLGLDSAPLLARYRAQTTPHPVDQGGLWRPFAAPGSAAGSVRDTADQPRRAGPASEQAKPRRWLAPVAAAVLLLVVVSGAAAAVVTFQDGSAPTETAAASERLSAVPVTEPPASEAPSDAPSEEATGTIMLDIPQGQGPSPEGLTMKLEFTETVWIRVLVDGANQLEGIMRPGAVTQFVADKKIELRVGRADAVEYSLNGAWYGEVASDLDGPVDMRCDAKASCRVTQVG